MKKKPFTGESCRAQRRASDTSLSASSSSLSLYLSLNLPLRRSFRYKHSLHALLYSIRVFKLRLPLLSISSNFLRRFRILSLSSSAMADFFEEGKQQFSSVTDGNAPVKYSSFKAPKPSFGDGGKHSTIDVFPLLVKEAAFPLKEDRGIDTSLVQDVCTISVLPDEGNTIPQCTSQFTLLSFVKALLPSKNQMLIDAQLNCQKTQNRINVLLGGTDSYQSCVVDINVEKGNGGETVTSHDEVVGSVKSESVHMQKVLQRQASLSTDKAISERCHDAPTNRWRRYKRAASFDSRKIVILFSILSSVGTLILIYLTLRVKQRGDINSFNHM